MVCLKWLVWSKKMLCYVYIIWGHHIYIYIAATTAHGSVLSSSVEWIHGKWQCCGAVKSITVHAQKRTPWRAGRRHHPSKPSPLHLQAAAEPGHKGQMRSPMSCEQQGVQSATPEIQLKRLGFAWALDSKSQHGLIAALGMHGCSWQRPKKRPHWSVLQYFAHEVLHAFTRCRRPRRHCSFRAQHLEDFVRGRNSVHESRIRGACHISFCSRLLHVHQCNGSMKTWLLFRSCHEQN